MAIQFNEIGDHYEVTNPVARNFPAGDWAIAFWTRIDENPGSAYKYALSNGAWGENGSIQIYLNESNADYPNQWTGRVIDDVGKNLWIRSSSAPGGDLRKRLILLQRNMSSNRLEFWFCEYGKEPVLESKVNASSLGGLTGPKDLWIGGRADGNPDRFFGGVLGEVFRGDFALSAEQIKALGMGHPAWALGRELALYLPLSDSRLVQRDQFGNSDALATKPGVSSAHFPLAPRAGSVSKWTADKPPQSTDLLIDLSNVPTAVLPSWDDRQGTAYLEDGDGNRRAITWSPEGFTVVNNGAVTEQYPPEWTDPIQIPGGKTYHFSSSTGDNANDGLSKGSPKRDISELTKITLKPGDSVLLKRGDTWVGQSIKPSRSGVAGNVIKYGAYGAGTVKPALNGEGIQHIFYCAHQSHIWVDGLDFYNGALAYPASVFQGQVRVAGSKSAFITDITFTDCVIRESRCSGMTVNDFVDNITIKDCVFHGNPAWGLMFNSGDGGKLTNNVIRGCEFYDNAKLPDPTGSTGTEPCNGISGDTKLFGCYFHDNNSSDHWLYRGWSAPEKDEWRGMTRIHDNIFDAYGGTASYCAIGCKGRGARQFRNKIYSQGQFGVESEIAYAADGGTPYNETHSHHNLIVDIKERTPWDGGMGVVMSTLKRNDENGRGEHNFWNNTIDDCLVGYHTTSTNMTVDGNAFRGKNNLITNMAEKAARLNTVVETLEFDYNYYFNCQNKFGLHGDKFSVDFAAWKSTYGHDQNSIDGTDPLYTSADGANVPARDYSLKAQSPAREVGTDDVYLVAGDPSAWIGINYVPHATTPDAGAYQYLSGKTLDFSKYFVGLRCKSSLAQRFKLWRTSKEASSLRALTSA